VHSQAHCAKTYQHLRADFQQRKCDVSVSDRTHRVMVNGRKGCKPAEVSDKQKALCIDTDTHASGKEFRQESDPETT
jgi:hypothetical protein